MKRPQPSQINLICGLLLAVATTACRPGAEPTPVPGETSPLPTPQASATTWPAPAITSTPGPTEPSLATPTTPPTATEPSSISAPIAGPTQTPPPVPALAIEAYLADVEDILNGKRLTFRWQTVGADKVRIESGTTQRLAPAWDVPGDGTLTVELYTTNYRNPDMTLIAYNEGDNQTARDSVSQTITIEWPCQIDYFFTPAPDACPAGVAVSTWAAEQVFEHGRMLWLQEIRDREYREVNRLYVLYENGRWQWYPDTWTLDQPENDPTIMPPEGQYQPIRGFGKVWREYLTVSDQLGWALGPEQGYDATWQAPVREFSPGAAYVSTFDNGVIELTGWQNGVWAFVEPWRP